MPPAIGRLPIPVCLVVALLAGAAAALAPQQGSWWRRAGESQAGAYWIKTDLEPDLARDLAAHLNLMCAEYGKRLAGLPPRAPTPMNVLLFDRQQDYLATLQQQFNVDATGTGGMFFATPSGSALAAWVEGLPRRRIEHVLQHEGFHQFAWSRFGDDLPAWVNEGLAEFFGESVVVDGVLVLGQGNPRVIDAVREAIAQERSIPFHRLLTMTSEQWSESVQRGDAALAYRQSWSMVHFLVYADAGRYAGRFEAYLKLINSGLPSEHAFTRAFETDDFDAFERRWKEYALGARPSAFGAALERIEFLARGTAELSRRGESPESLAALIDALRAAGFAAEVTSHASAVRLSVDEARLAEIPLDALCEKQPVFVVERARRRGGLSEHHKRLETAFPTPPSIRTENLRPRNLAVRWYRDRQTQEYRYEIEVAP